MNRKDQVSPANRAATMKRALCIWLPRWPLQRLAVARAELRSRAVVLYQLHASRGARVVGYGAPLADAPAALWNADPRQGGIGAGMPLAEATALASWSDDDAPGLHLELHDPLADRVALEALAQWCQRFSPSAGLEEGDSPESLLLDVSGLGPLFDGERALAECVVRELQQRGLTARVAIADTPGAAWAIAHFADLEVLGTAKGTRSDRLNGARSGKLNSAPNGSAAPVGNTAAILAALRVPLVVPPGRTWDAIAPLSVLALRLPPPICALLDDLGLRRIEQVAALARSTLLARFGPLVLARLDQATGAAAEAVAAQALPPERELEWLFEHPTGRREMIDAALMQLIARACQALARQGHGVLRLRCRFEPEHGSPEEFVVGLFRPSASEGHVGELVRLKLESARFREPVAAIRLTVLATDRLEYRQQEIFVDGRSCREEPRTLAALVDRLSNRLGRRRCCGPGCWPGRSPSSLASFNRWQAWRRGKIKTAGWPRDWHPREKTAWTCSRCRHAGRAWRSAVVLAAAPATVGGDVDRAPGPARAISVRRQRASRDARLGARADRNRLVAHALRAARLLPGGNRQRRAVLAVSRIEQPQLVFARRVCLTPCDTNPQRNAGRVRGHRTTGARIPQS